MRVLIIGGGQVGSELARRLSGEYQDVVLVEEDDTVIEGIEPNTDAMVVHGDGTSVDILRSSGVAHADIFIAVTQIDETNILASMIAKEFGVPTTVARIRNPEFEDGRHVLDPEHLGIDITISPERLTAFEIARHIRAPEVDSITYFGDEQVLMLSFTARENSDVVGKPLSQLSFPSSCIVAAIVNPAGEVTIPTGQDIVHPGDKIYLIGRHDSLSRLLRLLRAEQKGNNSVSIFGGGMIGFELARILETDARNGLSIKLIERDLHRCERLASSLDSTLVIHGDATDTAVLEEEVAGSDVAVSLLGDDEANLLTSLLAKSYGVKRSMSEIMRPEYHFVFSQTGVDFAINPRLSAVGKIVSLVRKGDIISLALLEHEKAEVVELVVPPTAQIVGRTLREAGLPSGIIVGTLMRENGVHIPTGNTKILPRDRLVIFAKQGMGNVITQYFS